MQWCLIYLTCAFTWPKALMHYLGTKDDRNCIKPHGVYMSGNINSVLSPVISVKKTKALAKKMNFTINDLMMGITSKVLKEYFVSQGDETPFLSLTLPFSFKQIPEDSKDYVYGN